ncbi:coniferyl aldehyde dehydrogenase [Brackiella oedipodis]|uniref:coniferyl aldehyde dehydrogenase n=1 Tax=Brackiella oedipodis TaxID=124225 RepID=UPI000A5F7ADA|nr:coniferyl aldehyde dehydrogenase [Brackiella oedipodis]
MQDQDLSASFDRLYRLSRLHTEVDWVTRRKRLHKLEQLVYEQQNEIADALIQDFGHRSRDETLLMEIFPSLVAIRHALKHGKKWMRARRVPTAWWFLPAKNRILPQPLGVVGIIVPWNYPLILAITPLVAAFCAGNLAMLKPSEFTPAFSAWLKEAVAQYFTEDELVIIEGEAETAKAFTQLPFDHLLFTGSTAVGKMVMQAAAQHLTPVTLELGGKSPTVILEEVDLDRAVARIMTGKLVNAGQTCIAPDYVLLPERLQSQFIQKAKQWVNQHYPNLPDNPDYTRIINSKQYQRLQHYLEALDPNHIHPLSDAPNDPQKRFMVPTIVTPSDMQQAIMQEEIFGPLLPLVTYDRIEHALELIKQRPRPLALYVFGTQAKHIDHVLQNTVAGGVSVNDTIFHVAQEDLPFGGVGYSGIGAYHGQFGFDRLSHLKPVFYQPKLNGLSLLAPPYGKRFRTMIKTLMK